MDKIKRIILLAVPCSICNFRCSYCYLSHRPLHYQGEQPKYEYNPKHVAKALSKKRLGGVAFVNICADGETLLAKNIDEYVFEILKEGHYVEFVTNLTIDKVLDRMLTWDNELLKRLEFKCSFHYLELKKKKLLDNFAKNVQKVWDAGASANIEITPSDELIPYLDEVRKFSMENFGALPHFTIARNDDSENIEYLTALDLDEYDRIWSQFDSDFWKFKKKIFMEKRKEFCYAGDWLLQINLATGNTNQCYQSLFSQNVFKGIEKPIEFKAIGRCLEAHCYNGHSMLTLGCIPQFTKVSYGNIRNRVKENGEEWLQPGLKDFFNTKLEESNDEYTVDKKRKIMRTGRIRLMYFKTKKIARKIVKKR